MNVSAGRGQLDAAANIFRALADPFRLKMLIRLSKDALNVTQLAESEGEKISTVSARLKILFAAHLVKRSREGRTIIYSIADAHVLNLVRNAIDHASETGGASS